MAPAPVKKTTFLTASAQGKSIAGPRITTTSARFLLMLRPIASRTASNLPEAGSPA